jgi:hypothetical protein
MFSLHERTQRRACRNVFVLACAVPTLLTLGWMLYFHRPWQERDWQRSIEHALHVRANVNQVAASRPLQRELHGLQLADLQAVDPFVDFDVLHIRSDQTFESGKGIVATTELHELAQMVRVWLSGEHFQAAMLHVDELMLVATKERHFALNQVRIESKLTSSGERQIVLQAEMGPDNNIQLVISRSISGLIQSTLVTGRVGLPAWLFSDVVPGASRWGSASIHGTLKLEQSLFTTTGNFRGNVTAIDTGDWIGNDSLVTQADLQLEEFRWRMNRIQTLQGLLKTSSGTISAAFLNSIKDSLFCVPGEDFAATVNQKDPITFDKLACRFQLDSTGFVLRGACVAPLIDAPGCMILASGKPLLMQPNYATLPAACFIHVFCPREEHYWIPATREANDMADKLPLPTTEIINR